jgi:hypothetical protein
MELLDEDRRYLDGKGLAYETVTDGANGGVILKGFPLAPGKYNCDKTDLLICIPQGYNDAKLDNFYCDPPVKLKDGNYPNAATEFEDHAGKRWQRFSRHLKHWRPGIDFLQNFMPLVERELQGEE